MLLVSVKGSRGCFLLLWCIGEKGYSVQYPSVFCRTYYITFGIGMLFRAIFPVLLPFFFKYATKSTVNHKLFCSKVIHMQSRKNKMSNMCNFPVISELIQVYRHPSILAGKYWVSLEELTASKMFHIDHLNTLVSWLVLFYGFKVFLTPPSHFNKLTRSPFYWFPWHPS